MGVLVGIGLGDLIGKGVVVIGMGVVVFCGGETGSGAAQAANNIQA